MRWTDYIKTSFLVLVIFTWTGCSNTKYLKEGELLYTGAQIDIIGDSLSKKEKSDLKTAYQENLRPKPNSSILGLRPKLYFYNITDEPKKDKGFKYWMKYKLGEKPVLLGDVDREFNENIIVNYSENKGYFNAKASSDTLSKNKKAQVIYKVKPGQRYKISQVNFPKDSSLVNTEIQSIQDKSLLKTGDYFDLDVIKTERERIDARMKERGFYYFHPDNIIVQADSTVAKNQKVELFVKLKKNTPEEAKEQFTINDVIIFPNYNLRDARRGLYSIPVNKDTLEPYKYKDMYIIDPEKRFKPKIFDRAMYVNKGDIYNRTEHNLSDRKSVV